MANNLMCSMNTVDELLSRIDTGLLYGPFLEMVELTLQDLLDQQLAFWATCGVRTFEEQNKLYARGRTIKGGKVTNAKGGFSAHQYGIAIDVCKDGDIYKAGLQPIWSASEYEPLAIAAEARGLESGHKWRTFKDSPHLQLPLRENGISMSDLIALHKDGGQEAVFDFLDRYSW